MKKVFGFAAVAALSVAALAACAPSSSSSSSEDSANTIKVGIMTQTDATEPLWEKVSENAKKEGLTLEFVEFTDYSQPNKALANGEIDVNAFQHYNFLNNWNQENGEDLVAIADTYIAPIRLYSGTADGKNKYTKVEEIPDGAEIAVPNDPTNESRALYLLQTAGLIKVGVSGTELATIADITENKKNLKITFSLIVVYFTPRHQILYCESLKNEYCINHV